MELELGANSFDVVVTLEVLSHVADQRAFIRKLARHLRPGGHLMLATQNRFVLQYLNRRPPPLPGQLRRWVDRRELRDLLEPEFEVSELFSVTPRVALDTMVWLRDFRARIRPVRAAVGGEAEETGNEAADQVGFAARSRRWLMGRLETMGLGWRPDGLGSQAPRRPGRQIVKSLAVRHPSSAPQELACEPRDQRSGGAAGVGRES